MALSIGVFVIAFSLAVLTTPDLQEDIHDVILQWDHDLYGTATLHWSIYGCFVISAAGLATEFSYVVKRLNFGGC
jgi:hypothetical protein